ncbi:hypothetical protein SASPL_137341 [Salvia splendens]|uniref:Cytochrome P450 n=1 Tax=Salvia splendens TaxID=180675 RepID=A0A8X8WTH6_SALSN|nr:hypothetical protein SASPL_137341 [Salvia splendens]
MKLDCGSSTNAVVSFVLQPWGAAYRQSLTPRWFSRHSRCYSNSRLASWSDSPQTSIKACLVYSRWKPRSNGKSPPGPPRLPIIGNMLQLGKNPHKSLARLSKIYGPLMSLKLGNQLAAVVSSPELAKEVLHKQGRVFSKPFPPNAVSVLGHNEVSMNLLPSSSELWKKLRRVAREKLFSNAALQASQEIRQERLRKLVEYISKCSGEGRAMNVGEATFTTMTNLMFATLFSIELDEFASTDAATPKLEFREHVNAITRYMGVPNLADFFPIFAPLDPQGMRRNLTYHLRSLLELVQGFIDERLQARTTSSYRKKTDFLETLLDMSQGNEYALSVREIKHLFVVRNESKQLQREDVFGLALQKKTPLRAIPIKV